MNNARYRANVLYPGPNPFVHSVSPPGEFNQTQHTKTVEASLDFPDDFESPQFINIPRVVNGFLVSLTFGLVKE